MAMKDRHVRRLMEAALDGTLETPERRRFGRHLASCEKCAAEYKEAATVRGQLEALRGSGLSDRDGALMAARLERSISGGIPPYRMVSYSLAGAAAVLLLIFAGRLDTNRLLVRSALSLGTPEAAGEFPQEARAHLAEEILGPMRSEPLVSFDSSPDLGGVSIAGFVQPGFVLDPALRKRVLRIGRGAAPARPLELIVPAEGGCRPSAVSAWIYCEDAPATVSLKAVTVLGRVIDVTAARRVEALEWQWVVFRLPQGETPEGETVREFRFGVDGDSAFRIDSLQAWCKTGGG